MAFGKKQDSKEVNIQDSKEYVGYVGQQKVIIVSGISFGNNNLEDLNSYLANEWVVKRVDNDHQGNLFYLIEKE